MLSHFICQQTAQLAKHRGNEQTIGKIERYLVALQGKQNMQCRVNAKMINGEIPSFKSFKKAFKGIENHGNNATFLRVCAEASEMVQMLNYTNSFRRVGNRFIREGVQKIRLGVIPYLLLIGLFNTEFIH